MTHKGQKSRSNSKKVEVKYLETVLDREKVSIEARHKILRQKWPQMTDVNVNVRHICQATLNQVT